MPSANMRSAVASVLTVAAITRPVVAGGNTWETWSSKAAEPAPVEVGWTDWLTTTEYKETTKYSTVTETVTAVVTQAPPPPETIKVTETVVSSSVVTVENTVVNTATEERTVTGVSVVTSLSVATEVVSVSYCPVTTSVLTGLVPCPTRITNSEYSPPTPLPSNYLWGCAPGFLCHPKKVNCNFESNPPADSYICAPEDCLPVAERPPNDAYLGYEDVNSTCAWLEPVDDYFNVNPTFFELDFSIFKAFGQEECSYVPPPPAPTSIPPPPPPPPAPSSAPPPPPPPPPSPPSSSSWAAWTAPAPVTSQWSAWNEPSKVTPEPVASSWNDWNSQPEHGSSAGWNNWQSDDNYGSHPQVTKRAELVERQNVQIVAGPQCYAVCNNACGVFQSIGLDPERLCDPAGDFIGAMENLYACTSKYENAGGITTGVPNLVKPLSLCRSYSLNSGATSSAEALTTQSPSAPAPESSAPAPPSESPSASESTPAAPPAPTSTESASSLITAAASTTVASASSAASSLVGTLPAQGAAMSLQANSVFTFVLSILALFVQI